MDYYEIYKKRMNAYGTDSAERLENGRRKNFEAFLKSSPHRTTFEYEDRVIECVFEPFKQDDSKNQMYILCRVGEHFKMGDIITIDNQRFMFFIWDDRRDSGYNRYVVLRMSHSFSWTDGNGETQYSEAYLFFQKNNMLKNELKSRSRSSTLYLENLKLNFLIMPLNKEMKVGTYLIIETEGIKQFFAVTGYDIVSNPGISYVSIDPTYERDLTPAPVPNPEDDGRDYFWIYGEDDL